MKIEDKVLEVKRKCNDIFQFILLKVKKTKIMVEFAFDVNDLFCQDLNIVSNSLLPDGYKGKDNFETVKEKVCVDNYCFIYCVTEWINKLDFEIASTSANF